MESVKFTFDNDFSEEPSGGSYSHRMQQISNDAFAQGKEQGYMEALQSMEKNSELILESINNSINAIMRNHEKQSIVMEKNATSLVLAIIKKLAPAIVKETPLKEIELLVQECLKNNPLEPRMVIRIDEKMLPLLRQKIDTIQTSSDYNGQIVLISDTMANISDCKVEWVDGGAERDFESLMQSIEKSVQNFIDAPSFDENDAHENLHQNSKNYS